MEGKKLATMSGTLLFPLSVGSRAVILHDGGYTHTSKVVAIHSVQPGDCQRRCDFVIFRRTRNVRKRRVKVCSL